MRYPVLLSKEVLLNFPCGMIFPLLKRVECYKRPLVTRLCHSKMFTSDTDILKKAETCRWFATIRTTSDFNWWLKHQQNQENGAWKSSINNSRTCGHGWNFIWISANNFEGSFGHQKSQIAFGRSCMSIKAFWLSWRL